MGKPETASVNSVDLQIHSTASDGRLSPREVVAFSRERGLDVVSLTDHDTIAGLDEAADAAAGQGIRLIPGFEFSVRERGAHILGYGIDRQNLKLTKSLAEANSSRIEGARETVKNLQGTGFAVEWSDVEREAAGASVIARPHIARAVLNRFENKKKLGSIATTHEFIQAYLRDDSPLYARREQISAQSAITLIHGALGVAVWAHPAVHFRNEDSVFLRDNFEQILRDLVSFGLDGIEVFTSAHGRSDAEYVRERGMRYGLFFTAGSDFHERGPHPREAKTGLHAAEFPGDYETHGFSTEDIVPRLEQAIERQKNIPR